MASASSYTKEAGSIVECSICKYQLSDGRQLPCMHTFCLKCLEVWHKTNASGLKFSCPLCRKEVSLSESEIATLPKNQFVEKLLKMKNLSTALSGGNTICEICDGDRDSSGKKTKRKASTYCVDCRRSMCEQCLGHHQKFRLWDAHKFVDLTTDINAEGLFLKFPENLCETHTDKRLEIYCFECKLTVCMLCYIGSHKSHNCSDMQKVGGDIIQNMTETTKKLTDKVTKCQTTLQNIETAEKKLCNSVTETKQFINDRANSLKQRIDEQKESLLQKVSTAKDKQSKQTDSVREDIERHQLVLENFIRFSNEVKQKGTACDIAKMASQMSSRSEELQNLSVETDALVGYNVTDVKFIPSKTEESLERLFGDLTISISAYVKPRQAAVAEFDKPSVAFMECEEDISM